MHRDQIRISEPCTVDWETMHGDAKRRFCDQCRKHVHNLSAMSEPEAQQVIGQGNVCVRFRYDAQGNVRHTRHGRLARAVALGTALFGAIPALAAPAVRPAEETGAAREPGLLERVLQRAQALIAEPEEEKMLMGDIGMPEPPPPPPPPVIMGKIAPPPQLPVVLPTVAPPPPLPQPSAGEEVIPEVAEALARQK